jgi:hypothetical protein
MAVGVTELLQQSTTIKISVTPATILNSILLMSYPWGFGLLVSIILGFMKFYMDARLSKGIFCSELMLRTLMFLRQNNMILFEQHFFVFNQC